MDQIWLKMENSVLLLAKLKLKDPSLYLPRYIHVVGTGVGQPD